MLIYSIRATIPSGTYLMMTYSNMNQYLCDVGPLNVLPFCIKLFYVSLIIKLHTNNKQHRKYYQDTEMRR